MAFPTSLTIGAYTFENLTEGRYIDAATTIDQPRYFNIDRTLNPDGVSSFVIKTTMNKNSGSVGLSDDVLQVHIVIKAPLKVFTQAEVEAHVALLSTFLSTGNVTKLLRGNR